MSQTEEDYRVMLEIFGAMIKLRFAVCLTIIFVSALRETVIDPAPLHIAFYSIVDQTIN